MILCGLTCAATTIFLLITAHPINLGSFLLATAILVGALLAWGYLACYTWHLIEPRSGSCNLITVQILGRSAGTGGSGQT